MIVILCYITFVKYIIFTFLDPIMLNMSKVINNLLIILGKMQNALLALFIPLVPRKIAIILWEL